ncbi:GNAT family N-acetyltransferase [Roseovarius sp. A46]|uniref:GNAT family N-acetyltransferase n=1 Tax=Roseovarius sp. A46 TaxID=2109331 RepID=UPI001010E4EC|nr:GNAT family N-acetyltransferase [Roseovarius sp. A46]RXV63863.1 GNAT family N-acetyltransferase [Roseovarius sp. A46]
MILRRATEADIPAILAIWNPLIRDTSVTFTTEEKTQEGLAAEIAARGDAFVVAEDAGRVLGFAGFGAFRAGPGYRHTAEHTVILATDARGRGTGRALMARLEEVARARGIHTLIGAVSGENAGAIAFHEAVGFARAGVLPEAGHKFGRWMDLVLFHKHP